MDLAQYVSDYVTMLHEAGEPVPKRAQLAKEIAQSLEDTDYGITATPEQIAYYL